MNRKDELIPALYRRLVIRMPKLKTKVSGAFRTAEGATAFCTIRSYLATLRKQGRDIFESLVLAFKGQPPEPILSG